MNDLEITTALQIAKPIHEVFHAIITPDKMSNYFISKASAPIEQGKTITWQFPEFYGSFAVHIQKVDLNKCICFIWEGAENIKTNVEISLTEKGNSATLVTINEKSMPNTKEGIAWLKRNTEGWANFLACLKAFLEFGINLRKGGFDFLNEK